MIKFFFSLIFPILLLFFASTVVGQSPHCTSLKVTTLPAPGDYGSAGHFSVARQLVNNPEPNVPDSVSVYLPADALPQTRVPIVFFAHGFGGTDFRYYDELSRHIASNGYAVVFAPYTANLLTSHTVRYRQMWAGFQAAVEQFGNVLDTTRIGFAGHSYGAGAVPELARRAVAAGWGANGLFIFSAAPWYSWGTNYEQIPASAKLIVQVYWDDETNHHEIGVNDVWNRLPQITEKRWQVIRATQTTCRLSAGHGIPVTGNRDKPEEINAYDYWGVWRKLHALADYTFTGDARARFVAFDDTQMGKWRLYGLRSVTPLETTTAPIVNSAIRTDFIWATRCLFSLGLPCSLNALNDFSKK